MSLRRRPGAVPAFPNRITTRTTASTAVADTTSTTADGSGDRREHGEDDMQDDAHHSDSAVSGLTSLSGDDDFERRMIEKAREDRRRAHGREQQAFRKARTHPRVGLTMANLERNEARTTAAAADIQSPRSSNGSTRSDPAIHAPAGWGRKGRTSRDWMRAITRGYQGEQDDVRDQDAVDAPDSPLSHKSFQQDSAGAEGAARQDSTGELDLTFDMNEASMLVSTPYLPRTTWQPPARLQPDRDKETDKEKENSPIVVSRKSVETLGVVASAERPPTRPFASRRSDSQDLLRLLARASNTPSPKATARPQSQAYSHPRSDPYPHPHPHLHPHPQAEHAAAMHVPATSTPHDRPTPDVPVTSSAPPPTPPPPPDVDATPIPTAQPVRHPTTPHVMGGWVDTPSPRTAHQPVHARPPRSQSPEQDSPAEPPPSESAKSLAVQEQTKVEQIEVEQIKVEPTEVEQIKVDQIKVEQTAADQSATEQPQEPTPRSVPRPQLPSSALHALVQEARAHHDYGDDTMHSLEELLGPVSDDGVEEDTLQGLTLPTSAPRSEAERERHAETVHIHRLREHLRATETNVRDVGRGMRRLETLMEHSQTGEPGEKVVIVRNITTEFSPWLWFRSFFWDERIKTQRQAENGLLKIWGGVTLFGILLTLSFIYWASETVACEIYCHPEYASYSPYPFAVNIHAPRRGRVIPTLLYRALFKSWSTPILTPIASLLSWIGSALWSLGSGISATALRRASYEPDAADMGYAGAAHTHASRMQQEEEHEEDSWEWSMTEDEVLRR